MFSISEQNKKAYLKSQTTYLTKLNPDDMGITNRNESHILNLDDSKENTVYLDLQKKGPRMRSLFDCYFQITIW